MNKTDFLAATTCSTMAWYQARRESPPPDEAAKFRMEQDRGIGDFARRLFPDGVLVHGPNQVGIADTKRLLNDEATKTIFEATFSSGVFTAKADVLNRNGDGWDVIEVKSGFSDHAKYIDDLAYTVLVLRRAGLTVKSSALLLSREYRYRDPVDKLFTLFDKTDDVDARTKTFEDDAEAIAAEVLAEHVPQPELNRACRSCYFFDIACLGSMHEHTLLELPKLHHAQFQRLCMGGVVDIADVPADFRLNEVQQRAKAAIESGETFVAPGLAHALAAIE